MGGFRVRVRPTNNLLAVLMLMIYTPVMRCDFIQTSSSRNNNGGWIWHSHAFKIYDLRYGTIKPGDFDHLFYLLLCFLPSTSTYCHSFSDWNILTATVLQIITFVL